MVSSSRARRLRCANLKRKLYNIVNDFPGPAPCTPPSGVTKTSHVEATPPKIVRSSEEEETAIPLSKLEDLLQIACEKGAAKAESKLKELQEQLQTKTEELILIKSKLVDSENHHSEQDWLDSCNPGEPSPLDGEVEQEFRGYARAPAAVDLIIVACRGRD